MNVADNYPQDVLGREDILDSIVGVIKSISNKKGSSCFSIDGGWGVGKSFILDLLDKELDKIVDEDGNNKIKVFRYDCWKYDYYDEPIVAIVSVLMDEFLSDYKGENVKDVLNDLRKIAYSVLAGVSNNISGVDLKAILEDIENEKIEADAYFPIKRNIEKLRAFITKYSKKNTIVFLVDELDRCLPEYSIKVLERLHHIFYGIENVVVIIALDGKQLEYSVKNIFGNEMDFERYIKKFIDFRVSIDEGNADVSIFEKYNYLFGKYEIDVEIREYIVNMITFSRLDIRNIEKIISKIETINSLIDIKNYSQITLCVELTIEILKEMGIKRRGGNKNLKSVSENLNWFSEINKDGDSYVNDLVGVQMKNYLVELRKDIISNTVLVAGIPVGKELIKNEPIAIMFWIIDQIYDTNVLYFNKYEYKDLVSDSMNFYELSKIYH